MARDISIEVTVDGSQAKRDLGGVDQSIDKLTKTTGRLQESLGRLFEVAGGVTLERIAEQTTMAIINFGKAILADADALQKLSDKSGISAEGLQRLRVAGDDAGNTLDEIVSSINMMQKRLGSGDDSALGALRQLGINFDDLKKQAPDDQFITIATAIRTVKDPMEQVTLATEVFGRSGATLLPIIKRGMDDIRDASVGMSNEAVTGFDKIGDAITALERKVKGNIGQSLFAGLRAITQSGGGNVGTFGVSAFGRDLVDQMMTLDAITARATKNAPGANIADALAPPGLPKDLAEITRTLKDQHDALLEHQKALKLAEEQTRKFQESVHSLMDDPNGLRVSFMPLLPELHGRIDTLSDDFNVLDASVNEFHDGITIAGDEIATVTIPMFSKLPNVVSSLTGELDKAGTKTNSFKSAFSNLFHGDFSGGFKELGGSIKDALNPETIVSGVASAGISSLINVGLKGIGSLFGKLFDNPEKQINPIREAFVQAAGGLDALNQHAMAATGSLSLVQQLLNAKNAQQYQVALDALNGAFATFDGHLKDVEAALNGVTLAADAFGAHVPAAFAPIIQQLIATKGLTDAQQAQLQALLGRTDTDLQHVVDTAKRYGLSLDDLGSKTQQLSISQRADDIVKDFGELTDAGADYGLVVNRFAASIQQLVIDAGKYGSSLPTALRPIAQALVDSGQLTDIAGVKLHDLSGIKFDDAGDPLKKSLDSLTGALNTLTALLAGLPANAATAAAGIAANLGKVDIGINAHWNLPDPPGVGDAERYHQGGTILPFVARAHSGLAIDEVPIIAQRGEGILNRGAMRRLGGASGLNALNAGSGGSGLSVSIGDINVSTSLNASDAEDVIGKTVVKAMRRRGVRFSNR